MKYKSEMYFVFPGILDSIRIFEYKNELGMSG